MLPALCSEDPPDLLRALVWPESSFLVAQLFLKSWPQEGFECNGTECNPAGLCVCRRPGDREKHKEIVGSKQSFFPFFFFCMKAMVIWFLIRESVCVCLCIHVHGAGATSSMGMNFTSQETSTSLYCGDEFPRDIECSVAGVDCSGCSWQTCHGGHFCAKAPGLLLPCGGSSPIMFSDKAACLLLGQAQARWVCTVPVAAGHQQGWGFAGVAQTPAVAFINPDFLLDT